MHLITTWKTRPLSPEQFSRLMAVWGKLEERSATDPSAGADLLVLVQRRVRAA